MCVFLYLVQLQQTAAFPSKAVLGCVETPKHTHFEKTLHGIWLRLHLQSAVADNIEQKAPEAASQHKWAGVAVRYKEKKARDPARAPPKTFL